MQGNPPLDPEEVLRPLGLKRTQPGEPPSPKALRALTVAPSDSGPGMPPPDAAILEHQRKQTSRHEDQRFQGEVPAWLRALAERKATDEEVVQTLARRMRRAPTHDLWVLAGALCRDLARKPGGTQRIKEALDQELFNAVTGKGE